MCFDGFRSGALLTPLPQALLRDLVPQMADPAELIVTLYAVEAIARQRRFPRRIALAYLRDSRPLIDALAGMCVDREVDQSFAAGLSAALDRGVLLSAVAPDDGARNAWLALNDADGRRAMELLDSASVGAEPMRPVGREAVYSSTPEIWQSAFGTPMPPILAEALKSAESRHGRERLRGAFAEAAANGARSWRYVQAILDRWEMEGRDDRDETAGPAAGGLESSRYRHIFRD